MSKCEKESNEKIKNIDAVCSESISKFVKIKSNDLYDEKKDSIDKTTQNKDIMSNEYYFLFWN